MLEFIRRRICEIEISKHVHEIREPESEEQEVFREKMKRKIALIHPRCSKRVCRREKQAESESASELAGDSCYICCTDTPDNDRTLTTEKGNSALNSTSIQHTQEQKKQQHPQPSRKGSKEMPAHRMKCGCTMHGYSKI